MFLDDSWTDPWGAELVMSACMWALLRIVASWPTRPPSLSARCRARLRAPFTSVLGFAAALVTLPPAFSADQAPSPRRSVELPWSRTSGFPPLHPLVPTRATEKPDDGVVNLDGFGAGASYRPLPRPTPAVAGQEHERQGREPGTLLLPSRIKHEPQPPTLTERQSDELPTPSTGCRRRYQVAAGDSLWSIAGRVLGTEDPRRIARYWPRIHRFNRGLIGTTPNLIKPGWVLDLPPECD
jgi:hypothetical protein